MRQRLTLLCVFLALLSALLLADYIYYRNRIYDGVYINGNSFGRLTMGSAYSYLSKIAEEDKFDEELISLSFEETSWGFRKQEMGITVDLESTLENALLAGRQEPHMMNYYARVKLLSSPVNMPLYYQVDRQVFSKAMSEPANVLLKSPQDANYILIENGNKVDITPDQPGQQLDFDKTIESILEKLPTYNQSSSMELVVLKVDAAKTASFLEDLRVTELISTFHTNISKSSPNRLHNIRLAAKALDGSLIEPDKEFSFNNVVGPANAAEGYKPAPVIEAGKVVEGIGGGVCQVSSTLYNAVLLADVSVVERKNHSLMVGYVPPGLDATIAHGFIDFRFLNDRDHAIWIRTFVSGDKLEIMLYGNSIPGQHIKVEPTVTEKIQQDANYTKTPDLPAGAKKMVIEGQPGYRIDVWRVSYIHGKEIKREIISSDTYKAVPDEYLLGTGE